MLRKYKHFVIGFLVGALLFCISPVLAESGLNIIENPFPIFINGKMERVEGYNINGYTFLKLADFGKTGLVVKFNETEKRIEIESVGGNYSERGEDKVSDGIEETLIEYKTVDGKEYVSIVDVKAYCKELYGGRFSVGYGRNDPTWASIHSVRGLHAARILKDENPNATNDEELIKSGVLIELPIEHINGEIHITRETFENTVLPFIDKWEEKIKGGF